MRQVGILAAAGIHALDHHIDRLADDHAMARRLADQLNGIGPITVDAGLVETNMLFMTVPRRGGRPASGAFSVAWYFTWWWRSRDPACYPS